MAISLDELYMKPTNKKYYTLQEVSKITKIPSHTIKFYERELKLPLKRNSAGRKIFSQSDIDKLLLVKHLRQQEKLTLAGIKSRLAKISRPTKNKNSLIIKQDLLWLQKELLSIKNMLTSKDF